MARSHVFAVTGPNTTPAFVQLGAYLANQISTTSGGSAGIRSDRTRPGGSIAWMPASVPASIRYGDAVDVASRAAYRSGYAGRSQNTAQATMAWLRQASVCRLRAMV